MDKSVDESVFDNVHKPQSYLGLKDGDYKLETYYKVYRSKQETLTIKGQHYRLAQTLLYLVLSAEEESTRAKGLHTAYLESDFYTEEYVKALYGIPESDRLLRLDNAGYEFYIRNINKKYNINAMSYLDFLARLEKEQAFLLPKINYNIENVYIANSSVNVLFSFEKNGSQKNVLFEAVIEPLSTELDTAPYVQRLKNFFEQRKGFSISVAEPIPAIANATQLNMLMQNLHATREEPVLRKGDVYVLDKVTSTNNSTVYIRYHNFNSDLLIGDLVAADQTLLSSEQIKQIGKWQRIFAINTFSDISNKVGRTEYEVYDFFNRRYERGARLFAPIDDMYLGSMDYMKVPLKDGDLSPIIFKYYPEEEGDPKKEKLIENANLLREESENAGYKTHVIKNGRNKIMEFKRCVP